MSDLTQYDLKYYNFYTNKVITLEFDLNNSLIYEAVKSNFLNTSILEKFLESSNIESNVKENIQKYLKAQGRSSLTENTKDSIYKFILSDNKYKDDFSSWIDLKQLEDQVEKDINRTIIKKDNKVIKTNYLLEYMNGDKKKLYSDTNDKIKKLISLAQGFMGIIMDVVIAKMGYPLLVPQHIHLHESRYYNFINNNNELTFNDITDYGLLFDIISNKIKKLFQLEFEYKIKFSENKLQIKYKCKWEKKYFIDFMKLLKIYYEKTSSDDINNIYFLLNNKLSDESNEKLCILLIKLINNINDVDNLNKILKYINKNLIDKIYIKIPIKKNETKKNYQKDFLLINFNEDKKSFNDDDASSMLIKILVEQPSFIVVSTQDCKTGGKNHYQHLLGENLKNNGYTILIKNTIDKMRMRIYYNSKKVKFNEKEKARLFSRFVPSQQGGESYTGILKKSIIKKTNNVSNNLIKENLSKSSNSSKNLNKDIFLVKKYGLKESKDKKYGNGLVFIRLEISKNNSFTKFIFINCDLSLNDKDDQLQNIINDFKLLDYLKKEYNIFFCGNFNIFEPFPNIIKPENFIKDYSTNISINKKKSSKDFIPLDKLSRFLRNKKDSSITKPNNKIIPTLLLESIDKLGIHPTYKYIKDKSNKQVDFYNDIIHYTNKLKDIIDKDNRYIIKFLNIPNLLEKIKNDKNLIHKYFKIFIQLELLEKVSSVIGLNGKKIYSKKIISEIMNKIINAKEKNFINSNTFSKFIEKYNIEDHREYIQSVIKFSEGLNEQIKESKKNKTVENYLKKYINNKDSINKIKNSIEKYIKDKDIYKLNDECKIFIYDLINKGILIDNEQNDIFIEKKRDDLLKNYKKIFNTENNKIIPYQPSRILYSISKVKNNYYNPIIPTSFDFDIYLFPDKSGHKLTTLSFKMYDKDNNIINQNTNRSSITTIKGNNIEKPIVTIDFNIPGNYKKQKNPNSYTYGKSSKKNNNISSITGTKISSPPILAKENNKAKITSESIANNLSKENKQVQVTSKNQKAVQVQTTKKNNSTNVTQGIVEAGIKIFSTKTPIKK